MAAGVLIPQDTSPSMSLGEHAESSTLRESFQIWSILSMISMWRGSSLPRTFTGHFSSASGITVWFVNANVCAHSLASDLMAALQVQNVLAATCDTVQTSLAIDKAIDFSVVHIAGLSPCSPL